MAEDLDLRIVIVDDGTGGLPSAKSFGAAGQLPDLTSGIMTSLANLLGLGSGTEDAKQAGQGMARDCCENLVSIITSMSDGVQSLLRDILFTLGGTETVRPEEQERAEMTKEQTVGLGLFSQSLSFASDKLNSFANVMRSSDASYQISSAVTGTASAISSVASMFGPAGVAVGAFATVTAGAVAGILSASEAMIQRGRELAIYSPQLAVAGAQAEVAGILMDIKEAMTIGPALAKLTTAQSEMKQAWQDLMLPLKEGFIQFSTKVLEILTAIITKITEWAGNVRDAAGSITGNLDTAIQNVINSAGLTAQQLADIKKEVAEYFDASKKSKQLSKEEQILANWAEQIRQLGLNQLAPLGEEPLLELQQEAMIPILRGIR